MGRTRWTAAVLLAAACGRCGAPDEAPLCDLDAGALFACVASCDDGDPCTVDLCAHDGTCRHAHNCAEPACQSSAAAADCAPVWCGTTCDDVSGPCIPDHSETGCAPNAPGCNLGAPLRCDAVSTCSDTGACIPSPRRWVAVTVVDAGSARVDESRTQADDGLVHRWPDVPTLINFPDAGIGSAWLAELDSNGQVVRAEPLLQARLPCLFYDCAGDHDAPRTWTGLPQAAAVEREVALSYSKLGIASLRPANGQYRVRIVTLHTGAAPSWEYGALLACDRANDGFRNFWPNQAHLWTDGGQSLSLEFVDEGTAHFQFADGGLGDGYTVFQQMAQLFPLAPREVLLVVFETVSVNGGSEEGGVAYIDKGIAVFQANPQLFQDRLWVVEHELGHLFGASDLYETDRTSAHYGRPDCAYESSDEIPGPNLYCGDGSALTTIVPLTAQELGWLELDGGPAAPGIACRSLPGSTFACDP